MKSVLIVGVLCYVAVSTAAPPNEGRPSECMGNRPKVKPYDCCQGAKLIEDSALTDCKAEYLDSTEGGSGGRGPKGNPCIMDCYFNKTGIFSNGEPVKAVALDVLGQSADASIVGLLNEGIDKCIAVQEEHEAMRKQRKEGRFPPQGLPPQEPDEMDKKRCRPDAKFFLMCVQFYVYKNCPADKAVSTDECVQFNAFTDKCMPPMFN